MLWPADRLFAPPQIRVPDGYRLRVYNPGDKGAYLNLMKEAGFAAFTDTVFLEWQKKILPNGLFLIEHLATHQLAATTLAAHNPVDLHPYGGELGWVAGSPAHAGKGLGKAACAAVTARFISAGYERIYLKTDDFRLPAVKIYLQSGYVPFLYLDEMEDRWKAVCSALHWPFVPAQWPSSRLIS